MPSNKPSFPNLRPVKKVVTPQGEILIRKNANAVTSSWGQRLRRAVRSVLRRSENEQSATITAGHLLVGLAVYHHQLDHNCRIPELHQLQRRTDLEAG
jgi:hypothetical protein